MSGRGRGGDSGVTDSRIVGTLSPLFTAGMEEGKKNPACAVQEEGDKS